MKKIRKRNKISPNNAYALALKKTKEFLKVFIMIGRISKIFFA